MMANARRTEAVGPRRKRKTIPGEAQLGVDLPEVVIAAVDAFVEVSGMAKKRVVELALRRFLKAEGVRVGK